MALWFEDCPVSSIPSLPRPEIWPASLGMATISEEDSASATLGPSPYVVHTRCRKGEVKKTWIILALALTCLLILAVGCEGKGQGDPSTTVASEVASLDPALLGKWRAIESIPEQNADYLGSYLDFRVTTDDEGNLVGQLVTPTGNGVTGYGDLYARGGVIRLGGYVRVGVALEGTYTVLGDTLTIVPAAATRLATVVYRRVAE